MQTIALRENVLGAFSIHEPAVAEPIVLDCGEFTATTELRNFLPQILDSMGYIPLRRLDVEIHDSRVVLRGSVPTFYLKQLAQCTIRMISADCEIVNLVEVIDSP